MIDILFKAATSAGQVLLKYFRKDISVSHKMSHHSLVSEADFASQKEIQSVIIKLMLDAGYKQDEIGFIGEEKLLRKGKHTFVIDPLDGTNNFVSDFGYFSISIAYFKEGILSSAVVHHPTTGISYFAQSGRGAYKLENNTKTPLKIKYKNLSECLFNVYLSSNKERRETLLKIIANIFPLIRGVRLLGSIALDLANFADNSTNIVIDGRSYIWDIAAADLIIKESGGVLVDWEGKEINYDFRDPEKCYRILASHPKNLAKLLNFL